MKIEIERDVVEQALKAHEQALGFTGSRQIDEILNTSSRGLREALAAPQPAQLSSAALNIATMDMLRQQADRIAELEDDVKRLRSDTMNKKTTQRGFLGRVFGGFHGATLQETSISQKEYKMTEQDLIDSGYKRFRNHGFNLSDYGYQKKFTDDKGVMYFITIWVYDYFKHQYASTAIYGRVGFSPDIQFCIKGDMTVNISYIPNEDSKLSDLEKKVHDIWIYHGKPYYELYN